MDLLSYEDESENNNLNDRKLVGGKKLKKDKKVNSKKKQKQLVKRL